MRLTLCGKSLMQALSWIVHFENLCIFSRRFLKSTQILPVMAFVFGCFCFKTTELGENCIV